MLYLGTEGCSACLLRRTRLSGELRWPRPVSSRNGGYHSGRGHGYDETHFTKEAASCKVESLEWKTVDSGEVAAHVPSVTYGNGKVVNSAAVPGTVRTPRPPSYKSMARL